MEVSMKRSGIACCEKVFEYAMPVEQAAETVVPDTMPDVERVLCAEGTVIIKGKEVQDGRVSVTAGVAATVLYAPEGGGKTCVLGAALSIGGWIFFGVQGTKLTDIPHVEGFACMFGIMLGMLGLWLGSLIEREKMHRLFKFAVFAIAFAAASVVVMQVMKNIWCRMRYRDMLKVGSEDGFTPWYKIMFGREDMIEDGDYTSFPSGHTSSAAHIFLFAALCDIIPGWDKKGVRIGVNIGCTAFTVVVAISRIVANAHFLSDVLVGGYLTYLIFVALRRAFFGKGKYNFAVALPREEKTE